MKTAVIIPTYNRAALLIEALESVLRQTAPPNQVIIVDDGSTDDTAARIEAYRTARGMEYIRQENAHLSAARNTGTRRLAPDIEAVLYLDDDDRLLPDALERLTIALAVRPDAPLAYGRPRYISPDGLPLQQGWGLEDFDGPGLYPRLMRRNFVCTAGCVLLRRSALEAAGEWDTSLRSAEDWDMWLRLSESDAPFARVPDPTHPVLEYRVHPESMSKNRERMLHWEEAVCRKHRDRAPEGSERRAVWDRLLAERAERLATAAQEGASLDEALLTTRHRTLRRLIERLGIAALYRRAPLALRLRLRGLFGVETDA